jgi:hypothetical protein
MKIIYFVDYVAKYNIWRLTFHIVQKDEYVHTYVHMEEAKNAIAGNCLTAVSDNMVEALVNRLTRSPYNIEVSKDVQEKASNELSRRITENCN